MILSDEEEQFSSGAISDSELFAALFSVESLEICFKSKFKHSASKGVDRLNGFQFLSRASAELTIASMKSIGGTYRFSPYLETLKTKGRKKTPRLIGIPTIRDRVVLCQLNRFLAAVYPHCVSRNVASAYVREIANDFKAARPEDTWFCSTDIKAFYDSIQRERLLKYLKRKIKCQAALGLIRHALLTPTVPQNTRRSNYSMYSEKAGVPQGLAISNILASIYIQNVDKGMKKKSVKYYRYVDDVLIHGNKEEVFSAFYSLERKLKRLDLEIHPKDSEKTKLAQLGQPFGYLGYYFEGNNITVRSSTIERFLHSITAKFSEFVHNKNHRLEKFKYLTEERLANIFLLELNERITGAVREKRRYGWIAYFSQINDMSLLYTLDHAIRGLFCRLPEFDRTAPEGLKSLSRAYWEMRFNPGGGYVRDYDKINTREEKLQFLEARGRIAPEEELTDDQIEARFSRYVNHVLHAMHADEGAVYS